MVRNLMIAALTALSLSLFNSTAKAQTVQDTTQLKQLIHYLSEIQFQDALTDYVEKMFVAYGIENVPREKFLVTVMRLVNEDMRDRIRNPREARDQYFKELDGQLGELQDLKKRLKSAGISELDSYLDELEARLKLTMRSGVVNYKKKKVFEDALQLLYVAEEMIKLDQLSDTGNLDKKISSSKDKLLNAFGEVGNVEDVHLDVAPTIFNLFEEWKKTEQYQYDARLLDVKIARSNLIKSGSVQQVLEMFNRELRTAYSAFNFNEYDLADRLLEDLVETYSAAGIKDFEDVYFYWAESNFALQRFLRAQEIYQRLLAEYPGSGYLAKTYSRLIEISYKLDQYQNVANYYSRYQTVASPTEPDYYDIQFVAALTLYNQSDFNKAVDILLSFPKDNSYYYFSQYLVGTIYAAGQNYDLAQEVFQSLITGLDTPIDIYSRSYYKLSLINYQQSNYLAAINDLSYVPEDYARYDKVLNVLAWSFFKYEQTRGAAPEDQNYTQAKYFAHRLLDEYYASEHRMEAESLLGYIYQLENQPELAVDLYKDVYESKAKKNNIQEFLEERDKLEALYDDATRLEEKALRANDSRAYVRASDVADALDEKVMNMDLAELSPVGSGLSQEINGILDQLDQLVQMKERAKAGGNTKAMMKIDSTVIRLTSVLDQFPEGYLNNAIAYNWFDAYPVARRVADYDFNTNKNTQLRDDITSELDHIESRMSVLEQQVERAKLQGDYKKVVALEREKNKLLELQKKYDHLYSSTYDLSPGQPYPEFDRWGDFGAFGIIDVSFGQRSRIQKRMADVSTMYTSVVDILGERREVVEDKLKKIEAEIRFMTMKARLEERQRLRAERERSFRETYFDKRTSEFEEK